MQEKPRDRDPQIESFSREKIVSGLQLAVIGAMRYPGTFIEHPMEKRVVRPEEVSMDGTTSLAKILAGDPTDQSPEAIDTRAEMQIVRELLGPVTASLLDMPIVELITSKGHLSEGNIVETDNDELRVRLETTVPSFYYHLFASSRPEDHPRWAVPGQVAIIHGFSNRKTPLFAD